MTEEQALVQQARQGDEGAFAALVALPADQQRVHRLSAAGEAAQYPVHDGLPGR